MCHSISNELKLKDRENTIAFYEVLKCFLTTGYTAHNHFPQCITLQLLSNAFLKFFINALSKAVLFMAS